MIEYKCPECNCTNLSVRVSYTVDLMQFAGETPADSPLAGLIDKDDDADWDSDSHMTCKECDYFGRVKEFRM